MNRQLLKAMWLAIPRDKNAKDIKEIQVISNDNKDWFIVKTITDVAGYYASSSQGFNNINDAIKFAKGRNKENDGFRDYTKYKLVINQKQNKY